MRKQGGSDEKKLNIAMLGHKRIPSREGGVEIVVEELAVRMVKLGHHVTCYNRRGHHVSGSEFDVSQLQKYKGVRLKTVWTLDKKGLAAMTSSIFMRKARARCYGFQSCLENDALQQSTALTGSAPSGAALPVNT